jgi:hypothetical protein
LSHVGTIEDGQPGEKSAGDALAIRRGIMGV